MRRSLPGIAGAVAPRLAAALACCGLLASAALAGPAEDSLRQRLEEFIRARAQSPISEISLPPLGDFVLEGVDPASIRVDLSTRASSRNPGTVPVSVVVSDGRRVLKRGVVTVRVRSEREVVVAARNIGRGERLVPEDLRVERRDAASLPDSATSDEALLIGMAATRSISSGTPVRSDWIEQPAVVVRGQQVRLVLQAAHLRIETTGVAMSKGAIGDTIRVVNSDSRREVTGRVGADGAIHVAF